MLSGLLGVTFSRIQPCSLGRVDSELHNTKRGEKLGWLGEEIGSWQVIVRPLVGHPPPTFRLPTSGKLRYTSLLLVVNWPRGVCGEFGVARARAEATVPSTKISSPAALFFVLFAENPRYLFCVSPHGVGIWGTLSGSLKSRYLRRTWPAISPHVHLEDPDGPLQS